MGCHGDGLWTVTAGTPIVGLVRWAYPRSSPPGWPTLTTSRPRPLASMGSGSSTSAGHPAIPNHPAADAGAGAVLIRAARHRTPRPSSQQSSVGRDGQGFLGREPGWRRVTEGDPVGRPDAHGLAANCSHQRATTEGSGEGPACPSDPSPRPWARRSRRSARKTPPPPR